MEVNAKLYGKVGDTFYATGYNEQELETLSTQHAKMVEYLENLQRKKTFHQGDWDDLKKLLSSIKKGGSDE